MKRTILSCIMLALAGCATTDKSGDAAAPRPERGFAPLFDGTSLDGWTRRGGAAAYSVEDGCIVGETRPDQPNTFLCTNETFRDFILELDFMIDPDPEFNSGIQIRSNSIPEHQNGRVHGYQVEIDPGPRAWTGGIYDEGRRGWLADLNNNAAAREAYKPAEWNHFRIEAIGDTIRTSINGVHAVTLTDSMTPDGFIGLQVHGVGARTDPIRIRWRDIRIKKIKPAT